MARPLERKKISSILKRNKDAREQPLDVGASLDPLSDAVFDVPEDAPADYGDAGMAPVLGNPDDDRLAEARGSFSASGNPQQFSGRYAERTNAGPEDLRTMRIGKVNANDDRYISFGEHDGAEAPAEAPAGKNLSPGQLPTEEVSWGGVGNYNYTYIPQEGGSGIIKGEGIRTNPDGTKRRVTFTLDPSKGLSDSNMEAYGAILTEMTNKGYSGELHDLTIPEAKPAPAAEAEEPNYGTSPVEPEPGDMDFVGPVDETPAAEPDLGESPIDLPPLAELPYAEQRDVVSRRAVKAEEPEPEPSRELSAAEQALLDSLSVPKYGMGGTYEQRLEKARAEKRKELLEGPDVPKYGLGGTYEQRRAEAEKALQGEVSAFAPEEEDPDVAAFRQDLLGPSFAP